jgi:hypothetical protein
MSVDEEQSSVQCDAVLAGKYMPSFWSSLFPLKYRLTSQRGYVYEWIGSLSVN